MPASLTEQQEAVRTALEHRLGENLEVLDPASEPEAPDGYDLPTFTVAGSTFGLLARALILRFRQHRGTTLQTA